MKRRDHFYHGEFVWSTNIHLPGTHTAVNTTPQASTSSPGDHVPHIMCTWSYRTEREMCASISLHRSEQDAGQALHRTPRSSLPPSLSLSYTSTIMVGGVGEIAAAIGRMILKLHWGSPKQLREHGQALPAVRFMTKRSYCTYCCTAAAAGHSTHRGNHVRWRTCGLRPPTWCVCMCMPFDLNAYVALVAPHKKA